MRSHTCLWMLAVAVMVCRPETIHFTNSPSHLLGSKNFTTYKLLVKDSTPITIIEANKEINPSADGILTNRRSDIDISRKSFLEVADDDQSFEMKKTLQVDTRPVSMTVTKDVNPSEGTNRNSDSDGDNGLKKLVYSPVLLKKFVKEYAEKLKNADLGTKNAIKEISEKINQSENEADAAKQDDVEEKYNYNSNFDRDRRRPVSNQPYKDRDGWVTLEAVPWSSSTVSKWHGNHHQDDERPSSGGYSTFNDRVYSVNSHRPGNYHHEEEEFYQRPKPYNTRPLSDDRPTYTAWSKPQAFDRPGRPHSSGGYSAGSSNSAFNDHDDWYDRDRPYGGRPWTGDIITDSRPSNFPNNPKQPPRRVGGYTDIEPYTNDEEDRYRPASNQPESQHPVNGNGEWVLISTTKGYQMPGRRQNGRRSLKFSVPASMDTTSGDITAHKSVKLTVLPALKNSTFSSDSKPTTSHGGMLEVDASHQSIESAVIDAKKKAAKPPPKATKKRKVIRGN